MKVPVERLVWSTTIDTHRRVANSVANSGKNKNWNQKQENKKKPDKNKKGIHSTNCNIFLNNVIGEQNGEKKRTIYKELDEQLYAFLGL